MGLRRGGGFGPFALRGIDNKNTQIMSFYPICVGWIMGMDMRDWGMTMVLLWPSAVKGLRIGVCRGVRV